MAEGVGFEPTIRVTVYTLSKRAPSAARPPLLEIVRHVKTGLTVLQRHRQDRHATIVQS